MQNSDIAQAQAQLAIRQASLNTQLVAMIADQQSARLVSRPGLFACIGFITGAASLSGLVWLLKALGA